MTDKVQLIREEIERQIEKAKVKCQQSQENNDHESFVAWSEHVATCGKLLVFINSLSEEPASEDLEEAATKWDETASFQSFYMQLDCNGNPCEVKQDITTHKESFKAGAEWQKQQIMKNAVDAFVNTYENTDDSNYVEFVTEQSPYKFKETEKCKLIIIKEGKQ